MGTQSIFTRTNGLLLPISQRMYKSFGRKQKHHEGDILICKRDIDAQHITSGPLRERSSPLSQRCGYETTALQILVVALPIRQSCSTAAAQQHSGTAAVPHTRRRINMTLRRSKRKALGGLRRSHRRRLRTARDDAVYGPDYGILPSD
jgi:hypothetical protein